jgi:predicted DNA-binding ribbon-helix-helix protein
MAKRSITVAGHRTSVSLEELFWEALGEIAADRGTSVAALIGAIDRERPADGNLSSAIRLFVLDWYRTQQPRRS